MKDLNEIRAEIDQINEQMLALFQQRMELAKQVIDYKKEKNIPILNKEREAEIIDRYGSESPFAREFFECLMEISRNWQTKISLQKNIVLIGMMGSGKTTIGKLLAKKLDLPFIDLDEQVEKTAGLRIPQIFEQGEEVFRNLEAAEAEKAAEEAPCVISTGGGVVLRDENMKRLKGNGWVIFLNRPIGAIKSDIDLTNRPMLNNRIEKLSEILEERLPLYQKYADFEIKSAKTPIDVMAEIIHLLQLQPKL